MAHVDRIRMGDMYGVHEIRFQARARAPDLVLPRITVTPVFLHMNEQVSHHRVVPGVRRDTHTSVPRSHESVQTLVCVIGSDEQRVTETSSE